MKFSHSIIAEQLDTNCDGWLAYDFRRSNPLACKALNIPSQQLLTRRFFYWVPKKGEPVKIVHGIEPKVLSHLPGKEIRYTTWQELENALQIALKGTHCVAMEYSPRNSNPYISKVDAGTVELVRSFGVEVVSSGNLIQQLTSVLSHQQIQSQQIAAAAAVKIMDDAWRYIAESLQAQQHITEWDVQVFIEKEIEKKGLCSDVSALCAVNAHSADPHYMATKETASPIRKGDFIMIDLGCKEKGDDGVYADITHVAVADAYATPEQQRVFDCVKKARDAACELVETRFREKMPLMGYEIDSLVRLLIREAGYGHYFIHRTGHNIGFHEHGDGTHLDSYETHDTRLILPSTCFSIEPGVYLPEEFGVRLEHDVLIHADGTVEMTGGMQQQMRCLFANNS